MNLDKNKTIKKSLQNQMKNIIGDDDLWEWLFVFQIIYQSHL